MEISQEILTQTEEYFKDRLNRFGATLAALDWNSKEAQRVRFDQLTKLLGGGRMTNALPCVIMAAGMETILGICRKRGMRAGIRELTL